MYFRPFSETILNVSNCLCELGISLIFILVSICLLKVPDYFYGEIDDLLVQIINAIMITQMAGSLLIFLKTAIKIIKNKRKAEIYPVISETENSTVVSTKKEY